jgi:hypothetical protein
MARVEIELPTPPDTVPEATVHPILSAVADGVRQLLARLHDL